MLSPVRVKSNPSCQFVPPLGFGYAAIPFDRLPFGPVVVSLTGTRVASCDEVLEKRVMRIVELVFFSAAAKSVAA